MNISSVVKNNLCVSCGLCAGVCPKKCITSRFEAGSYRPTIDEDSCVNCGLCHKVCPGKSSDYKACAADNIFFGRALICLAAQTKDKAQLAQSASGGVVTTLVKNLLRDGLYDAAFLVDTYKHDEEIFTRRYTAADNFANTPKSRYLTVNHSRAVAYMLAHPNERLILVGSSCVVQGLLNVIAHCKLNRENYFLAGLFCDKTMNYNVWQYFKGFGGADKLYFRTKEEGGWPGNVGIETGGKKFFLPREMRMRMKDFFCVERCRYCLDKLNVFADVSFGDNYAKTPLPAHMDKKAGTSSVIIRTERGAIIFERYVEDFFTHELSAQAIYDSQRMDERIKNFIFGEYKSAEVGYPINVVPSEVSLSFYEDSNCRRQYESLLAKQKMGRAELFPKVANEVWALLFPQLRQLHD